MIDFNFNKTYCFFWIFGLINNVIYVVILSAATDLVGPQMPKSLVLLVDILPAFLVKLAAPFFISKVEYSYRVISLIVMSCVGMILVANSSLTLCLIGIATASISSGFGEVTFLQLTHCYHEISLNGWSSGTGGAGLIGSGLYMLLTIVLQVPVQISLLIFGLMPFCFILYFQLDFVDQQTPSNEPLITSEEALDSTDQLRIIPGAELVMSDTILQNDSNNKGFPHLKTILSRMSVLFVPYMLPLTSVYIFEYLINQAVSPTLMFPIDPSKNHVIFKKYRDIYVTYNTLYQFGVFISRSTASSFRLKNLYILSALQGFNLIILILQSWLFIVKKPWFIMILTFYEGLLGGASYVNTFLNILQDVHHDEREFALGAVSIADSLGILVAALLGIGLEPALCKHQVSTGRPWCKLE